LDFVKCCGFQLRVAEFMTRLWHSGKAKPLRIEGASMVTYFPLDFAHLAFWAAAIRALPSALIFLR
jgi:hypothetical protein